MQLGLKIIAVGELKALENWGWDPKLELGLRYQADLETVNHRATKW